MFYFFNFCFTITRFGISLLLVRKKAGKQAADYLHQLEHQFGGEFDEETFKKIVKSHSIYLTIVNDAFTLLHGRKTTLLEQERSINYFICSSLFDNFFDDKILTLTEIESITFQSENYEPKRFDEKVSLRAHYFLLNDMKLVTDYLKILRREFEAQVASMNQFDTSISDEEIKRITFEKGGNAVLMCRYYLDIAPTKEEEECWYQLGTMIQLSNDLFDIYKDVNAGIQTLATRCKNAASIECMFLQQINNMRKNIESLPYSKSNKQTFSISMAATYSLGLVAIEQLKRLQDSAAQLPSFNSLPRKLLIVDMEKPSNIWRWLKFVYQYGKLLSTSKQVS